MAIRHSMAGGGWLAFLATTSIAAATLATGCSSASTPRDSGERTRTTAAALSGNDAVARAQQWIAAGMPYCQVPYGQCDSHVCCGSGYRPENPDWDPYRSDCSGLVSWAWNLGGPGPTTWGFAPFDTSLTSVIDSSQLLPGDAINSGEHIMLFAGWTVPGQVASLIDEHIWGTTAEQADFSVTCSGSTVTRDDWPSNPFTAIRYNGIQNCVPHCQDANTIIGGDCGAGNCAAYGASCVDDNLGARCVFYECPAQGAATVCLPDGHTIGTCNNGQVATGDCATYGAKCVDDNLGARCVFYECPAQGTATVCLPDGHTIGNCSNGQITTGDCAAYGSSCVDDDLGARCVFFACPAKGAKTVCLPDGHTLGNCDDGAVKTQDCASTGNTCETADGLGFCTGPLAATLVAKTSTAKVSPPSGDPTKRSDYTACAGQPVRATFELHDVGTLPWTDANDSQPNDVGTAVRLGTSDGTKRDFPDPFTGVTRVSLNASSNPDVSPTGGACNDTSGCARTVFTVSGTAPSKPGLYVTTWQLVDETRSSFGPVMALTFDVTACEGGDAADGADAGSGGTSPQASPDASAPGASGGCSITSGAARSSGLEALAGLVACFALARRRGRRAASRQR
jgi:hypothetical protein